MDDLIKEKTLTDTEIINKAQNNSNNWRPWHCVGLIFFFFCTYIYMKKKWKKTPSNLTAVCRLFMSTISTSQSNFTEGHQNVCTHPPSATLSSTSPSAATLSKRFWRRQKQAFPPSRQGAADALKPVIFTPRPPASHDAYWTPWTFLGNYDKL